MKQDQIRRASELRAQGLSLEIVATRLCVSKGHASKLLKRATELASSSAGKA